MPKVKDNNYGNYFKNTIDMLCLLRYNPIRLILALRKDYIMNIRSTIQRSLVLEAVKDLQSHVTANEIYDEIIKKHPDISRGTVYRNLNLLSEIGEIRKVEMLSGADRYELPRHEHYHAKCILCGRVFDVEMDFIKDLENNIKDTCGFKFTGHDIVFKGTCLECNI